MELLSATGQVMLATFLAASQFLEPLRTDYVTKVESRRNVQNWELQVYNFKPATLPELYSLSNEELAQYIRTSCLSMLDQMIPHGKRNQGSHFLANISDTILNIIDPVEIEKKQKNLIEPLDQFVLADSFEFIMRACDKDLTIDFISQYNLNQALDRYAKFYNEVPEWQSTQDLPELPEVSFVRDLDNNIIGEFNKIDTLKIDGRTEAVRVNRRIISDKIPLLLKKAIVSIEDAGFWNFKDKDDEKYRGHKGVEFKSFMRAGQATASTSGVQGGSTITMQLAKNLILYNDVHREQRAKKRSMFRKVRELILSHRLEVLLGKDEILSLYLNTIDFGRRSQGVEMAALSYFGKSVDELELSEIALIATLPKGPNYYNPGSKSDKVKARVKRRRNYVLKRMHDEGYISRKEMDAARAKPVSVISGKVSTEEEKYAHFYVSQVENEILKKSESSHKGFDIKVPINHDLQKITVQSLQKGLLAYERRKGRLKVRSYEDQLPNIKVKVEMLAKERKTQDLMSVYAEVLSNIKSRLPDASQFPIGVILSNSQIGLPDGSIVNRQPEDRNGNFFKIKKNGGEKKNLEVWDTVYVQPFVNSKNHTYYRIASTTAVQGGAVVMDIETGDVIATSGGFSIGAGARYKGSQSNRAFTADKRDPGSTVKPFTYLYALQKGLNPQSVISNERVVFPKRRRDGQEICKTWRPNSKKLKKNKLTLSKALANSQNYATLNLLAEFSGAYGSYDKNGRLNYVNYDEELSNGLFDVYLLMQRFGIYKRNGFDENICHSTILGSGATGASAAEIAAAYAAIARGGEYKVPQVIFEITKNNELVSNKDELSEIIVSAVLDAQGTNEKMPLNTYQLRKMLQGVVREGTASSRIKQWSSIIAGKTGTTDDGKDTWFVGFNKKIVVAVWVGYPEKQNLGSGATGASVALPIFKNIMEGYYSLYPRELENKFEDSPPGFESIFIEPSSGFVVDSYLQTEYERITGRQSPMPSHIEYVQTGENQQYFKYYDGVITEELAGAFYRDLSDSRKSWLEGEKQRQMQGVAREYYDFKDNCDKYLNAGYPENEIHDCQMTDFVAKKYYTYEDLYKFFLIYYNVKNWESLK